MSVPGTLLTPKVSKSKLSKTPRSIKKRTILNNLDQSYIEEDDATYVYGSDDDEGIESESELEYVEEGQEDLMAELEDNTEVESDLIDDKQESLQSEKATSNVEEIIKIKVSDIKVGISEDLSLFKRFLIKHEIVRKVLHSSIGFFTLYLYTLGVHHTQLIVPLTMLFAGVFTNDYIRLHNPQINRFIVSKFYYMMRDSEVNSYNGILYYLAGLILVFAVLPKDISLMSVLLLSWADTAASTFGRQFGKYTFQISKGKSFAGALASFTTGVLSCYLIYGYYIPAYNHLNAPQDILWTPSTSTLSIHSFALLSGLIASFSEFVNFYDLDDNFTIPVISGYLLYGAGKLFHV